MKLCLQSLYYSIQSDSSKITNKHFDKEAINRLGQCADERQVPALKCTELSLGGRNSIQLTLSQRSAFKLAPLHPSMCASGL